MAQFNHLASETSPYLLQHAKNPVAWYPWGDEALQKAKHENKPILLSIGYSACHWCHVMAHESFEDEETAKLMNALFINIKVDREERPDLDKVYQTAHYFLTQRNGGWPLTVFLTPDLTPFFTGTYFPKESRYQLPSFKEVLRTIADIYKNNPHDIQQQNQQLLTALNFENPSQTSTSLSDVPLKTALSLLQRNFDNQNGGFGHAPKFPNPTKIEFLIYEKSPLAISNLMHMAKGGIYDQLQGGFFRYSVDEKWQIPHFEKMLYDNAQLIYLYTLASREFNEPYFANIARETADWIIAKMQSPEGGYYSSLDADSEGHEGKYYIWNKFEIAELLTEPEAQFADLYFGLDNPPNFEKQWHLHVEKSLATVSNKLHLTLGDAQQLLSNVKHKLLTARQKRIAPHLDEKILTSWNALMIKAMIIAADILQEPRYLISAEKALSLIKQHLWAHNRLLVSYKDGRANLTAYLDDYAYLLDALVTFLQITWHRDYLQFAIQLANHILNHFVDQKNGGFFFTADDQEKVLYRPKSMMDEAIPSGNAIALRSLLILGRLLGETRYLDAVETTLQSSATLLAQFPAEHCSLLLVLQDFLIPSKMIILRGDEVNMKIWRDCCKQEDYLRNITFAISDKESQLPGLLETKVPKGKICAYLCENTKCLPVIQDLEELKKHISKS
ncbi:MAG: thioredoxin domain-containing protein [Gammaproteobacteria bacterium]